MDWKGILLAAVGLFRLLGAILNWDLLLENEKVDVSANLGRNGARIFYGLLGLLAIVAGLLVGFRIVDGDAPL
jgi:hypothetical protein